MFECITGLRNKELSGCILADGIQIGKKIQIIALL